MITKKILPVRKVRQNISRLLDETAIGDPVMITRHGRRAGYLIGYQALNQLLERLEDIEDLYWMEKGMAEYKASGGHSFEEFVAELKSSER